ncbi:MAG: DUF5678 domain-containing protein [Candidatus Omnitrophota bacterium]|nr:DUF5678 domain-containing protein [Candidatus Omnitrophota bacterium]
MSQKKNEANSFWQNRQWVLEHYNELASKYADKWIAAVKGKVIASGNSINEVEKIAEKIFGKKHIPIMFMEKGVHIYHGTFS